MTTARLLSEPPNVVFDVRTGTRTLQRELVVDLGIRSFEFEAWARDRDLHVDDGDPYWLASTSHRGTTILRVPPGLRYDGASLGVTTLLLGAKELYEVAAAFHDQHYQRQVPRDLADDLFVLIARSGSPRVTPRRGRLARLGLRLFGWVAYRRYAA